MVNIRESLNITEYNYRIACLDKIKSYLKGKRIALYGTGDNARGILTRHKDIEISVLIDDRRAGQYIYGKYVIHLSDALLLDIDVIIIAAEAGSSEIVSERIMDFCIQNAISLYNIYGKCETDRKRGILEQKAIWREFDKELFMSEMSPYDTVCIPMSDILCGYKFSDEEELIRRYSETMSGRVHYEQRLISESILRNEKRPYSTEDIYAYYRISAFLKQDEMDTLVAAEECFRIDNIIPYHEMTDIVNSLIDEGKSVFILSDYHLTGDGLSRLAEKIGLSACAKIVQDNIYHRTLADGLLRIALKDRLDGRTVFVGDDESRYLMLADAYGMDILIIQKFNVRTKSLNSDNHKLTNNDMFRPSDALKATLDRLIPVSGVADWKTLNALEFPREKIVEVSIVIPVYNQFEYTYNCLSSLINNTIRVPYEVIVIDDKSTDDTVFLSELVNGIKIIKNDKNMGFLRACNRAAAEARGRYIVFLNNDTQVTFNWLYPLYELMEKDHDIGICGSKLIYPDGICQEAGGIVWADGSAANYGRNDDSELPEYNYVRETDYISGASMMIRSGLWDDIGGFDEIYSPAYYEDTDLAFEIRKRGFKVVYQPASVVVHYEGVSNGTDLNNGIKQYQVTNHDFFLKKWKQELNVQYSAQNDSLFVARERKFLRKTILVLSEKIPTYDCDTGSNLVWKYMSLFIEKGYIVKFVARDFVKRERYMFELQQMGVEILVGSYYKNNIVEWIFKNARHIDYAWINYPDCADAFLDVLKCNEIPTIYFGHDLHFLRNKREYELNGDSEAKRLSKFYYDIENKIIKNADSVYYPSVMETEIAKREFRRNDVKYMPLYFYETDKSFRYDPAHRDGIMFIGGFGHHPNVDALFWFVNEIYSIIPDTDKMNFYFAGSAQPIEIQNIDISGITNLGQISDSELRRLYMRVKMVVVPLRYGAGVKGKVLDAMYYGVPMISTPIGIEGIPDVENIVDTAQDAFNFAQKLMSLYNNDMRLLQISKLYREYIRDHFSKEAAWESIRADFGEV